MLWHVTAPVGDRAGDLPVVDPAAEAALARAATAWEQYDAEHAIVHLSAALRALTAAGDVRRAAMVSMQLGQLYSIALGNTVAGRAWFARAWRLVADEPPCLEQGWIAVAAMGCDVDDPAGDRFDDLPYELPHGASSSSGLVDAAG